MLTGMNDHWELLSKEETDLYYFLLADQGAETAMQYLEEIAQTLKARWAAKEKQRIFNIDNGLMRTLTMGSAGIRAGLDQWAVGVAQHFTDRIIPTPSSQYLSAEIANSLEGFGKYAYGATVAVGKILPSLAISYAMPAMGVGKGIGKAAGLVSQGVSISGNAYAQARKEGYGQSQARTYGMLVGASEALLQYFLGGIGALGKTSGKIVSKLSMIDNSLLRISGKIAWSTLKEIGEEELQLYLEPAFQAILFGEDYDAPTIDEILETAIITALATPVLDAGGTTSDWNAFAKAEWRKSKKAIEKTGNSGIISWEALSRYLNSSDQLFENAKKVEPIDGYEDFFIHGDKKGFTIKDKDGKEIDYYTPREFAEILKSDPNYYGGAIRLFACESGVGDTSVAQMLANQLNVAVLAPSNLVWVDTEGHILIGSKRDAKIGRNTGKWVRFEPNSKG